MNRAVFRVIIVLMLASASVFGQNKALKFEVASVKPADPNATVRSRSGGGPGTDDPNRVGFPNATLTNLLKVAYGVQNDQISGPAWLTTERYTVDATLAPGSTADQYHQMLQNLLADRFGLTLHRETRAFNGYELVVAKGGPKLKPSAPVDPANASPPPTPGTPARAAGLDKDGFPILPPGMHFQGTFGGGMTRESYRESAIATLVKALEVEVALALGQPITQKVRIVDHTELEGNFDFRLEYAGTPFIGPRVAAASSAEGTPVASDPDSSQSIFSALEKQLGLKLVPVKTNVEVLVIDHAERVPSAN